MKSYESRNKNSEKNTVNCHAKLLHDITSNKTNDLILNTKRII